MADVRFDSLLSKKLNTFMPLSPEEQRHLADLQSKVVKAKRGKQLVQEGQTGHQAFILQSGWACSYKLLPNGSRQIISFPVAGDFIGLRSILLRTADHSFSSLTEAVVSPVDASRLMQTFNHYPRLASAILWAASRDEAMVVEHLVSVGRRSAIERTAHFFIELAERLHLVGLATETEFKCPLSQYVLADALGLSAIHVNRVLRELRDANLLTAQRGTVKIHDLRGLRKLGGFEGGYLNSRN
jgi:CRP-like cAMP-binding protein